MADLEPEKIPHCCTPEEPPLEEQLHEVMPAHFRMEWKHTREHNMLKAAAVVIEKAGLEAEWLKAYLDITKS